MAPLALYNFVVLRPAGRSADGDSTIRDNPPPSTVVISLGTDTTDLVITDGYRIWQRNIPLGGNHFTGADQGAEAHLRQGRAPQAQRHEGREPKAVFQAMRPVFNDFVTEVQRSIGFFTSINRNAKIGEGRRAGQRDEAARPAAVFAAESRPGSELGRGIQRLVGGSVTAVTAVQGERAHLRRGLRPMRAGLDKSQLHTNLLPRRSSPSGSSRRRSRGWSRPRRCCSSDSQ